MPPAGQAWEAPAEGQALQCSGVEEPTLIVENCLAVFFEPHLGQATLAAAVELDRSLSKAVLHS